MRNFLFFAAIIFPPVFVWADPPTPGNRPAIPVLSSGIVPIGSLGYRLGTYLTIEGRRAEGFKKTSVGTLEVDTINGTRIDKPIGIWVDNVDLPAKFHCAIKGYETVRMLGMPPAVEQAAMEAGKSVDLPQACWQTQLYFVALSGVALTDAKLTEDPVAAIEAVLPKDWTVVKVEENAYPAHRPKGKGKAIFLGRWETRSPFEGASTSPKRTGEKTILVVVYIMPPEYQDGISLQDNPQAANPARLIAATPLEKVYL